MHFNQHIKFFPLLIFFLTTFPLYAQNESELLSETVKEGAVVTRNNSLVFFKSGKEKFRDLFAAINQAKQSVHMEYFNFRDDSIANALFDLLAVKAKQGVQVRLLFDGFGNDSNNKPLKRSKIKELRNKGIEIYEYDPIRFPWVNHAFHRDHRKIVVIDGKTAYSGGMNVADYYINGKPKLGDWHDIHYRVEGDAVAEFQKIFLRIWNRTTNQNVSGPEYYPGESYTKNALKGLKKDTSFSAGHKTIVIVNREPHVTPSVIRHTFINCINFARKQIQIINPYFTLCHSIRQALSKAIKRGVNVEIMVSEKCDIPITPLIVNYNVHKLMKQGAHVYYYQGGFHHSKIMMVDSAFCFVGSANLDFRSLYFDYECNSLVMDSAATQQLQTIFNNDKTKHSVPLTDKYWQKILKGKKISTWFYHFLEPFVLDEKTNKAVFFAEQMHNKSFV